jgi:hypothetical protein
MRVLFLEYAWDMRWCDPCAADPLSNSELRQLGVFWLDADEGSPIAAGRGAAGRRGRLAPAAGAPEVFLTRLHVRYDNAHFPEDLVFQQTADRSNFQGRYVVRHAWKGGETCPATEVYRHSLRDRQEQEAQRLVALTGWDASEIRSKMKLGAEVRQAQPISGTWWERLWKK